MRERLQANIIAFGMTRRPKIEASDDSNLKTLVDCGTPIITLVGKSSVFHVKNVLQTSMGENLEMIRDSISYLSKQGRRIIYDAEHFFDAVKEDEDYAFSTVEVAANSGAEEIVLCDTRGPRILMKYLAQLGSSRAIGQADWDTRP